MKRGAVRLYQILALLICFYAGTVLYALNNKEAALLAIDQKRINAQIQGDVSTLEMLLGDDLLYVHAAGLMQSKVEFIADLKSGKRQYKSIKNSDMKLHMTKDLAVISAQSDIVVDSQGREVNLSVRIVEVYAKRGGRWQLIAYQATNRKL
jgi:hypothetical protein